MENKILVAYASTHGSTQEVAGVVAAILREHGLTVDLQTARQVRSLEGYGAVVLGAPLYMFHLHKDALRFLSRHQKALSGGLPGGSLPVAIFAGGPFAAADGSVDENAWQEVRKQLDQELAKFPWLRPLTVEVIGGRFDPGNLHLPWNLLPALRNIPASDLRDWEAIRTWASRLATQLQPVLVQLKRRIAMKSATGVYASTFGAVMALAGIEHGIGEILQGNAAPEGIMILSWPGSEFFRGLGGEPAMTVVPNLLLTGILAVLVSLALLIWSVLFVHRKNGGLIMILLSLTLLLVGGGIFPPVFGMLIGLVATRIHSPLSWWRAHLSEDIRRSLAKIWPWSYTVCLIAWPAVFPAGYLFGEKYPAIILVILCTALGTLILTVLASFAYDAGRSMGTGSPKLQPGT